MTDLETGRQAAVRDLDAILSRLRGLSEEDWDRPTPNEGWLVRHLAAHLVAATAAANDGLGTVVRGGRAEPVLVLGQREVTPSSRHADILRDLTLERNALFQTLSRLEPAREDGQGLIARIVMEFGLHRYDLEWSLGERYAGLSTETVAAIDAFYGARLATIGDESGEHPAAPTGFHLQGALIDRTVAWDGTRWRNAPPDGVRSIRIGGDDSALALFLCGRIEAGDARLAIDGDRATAARFKTFVPGP